MSGSSLRLSVSLRQELHRARLVEDRNDFEKEFTFVVSVISLLCNLGIRCLNNINWMFLLVCTTGITQYGISFRLYFILVFCSIVSDVISVCSFTVTPGVGIGIVDLGYERRLANQLGAHRAPSIIGLVNGRVTFFHQAVVREHLRQFIEDLLPQKLVEKVKATDINILLPHEQEF